MLMTSLQKYMSLMMSQQFRINSSNMLLHTLEHISKHETKM